MVYFDTPKLVASFTPIFLNFGGIIAYESAGPSLLPSFLSFLVFSITALLQFLQN